MRGKLRNLCLLLLLFGFQTACISTSPNPTVTISGVQNYIQPNIHEWDIKAGIFIFTSDMGSRPFSYSFTRGFQKNLLRSSIFRTVKLIDLTIGTDELAIRKGKEFGLDYAIYGHINEFRSVVRADTKPFISITFKIVDVRSGNTLWYIEDSISGDAPEYKKLLRMHSAEDYPPINYLAGRLIANIVGFLADFKAQKGS